MVPRWRWVPFLEVPNGEGVVRVYRFLSIPNVFEGYAQLGPDIVGESPSDSFGHSVSLSADGDALVVGAPNNNNGVNGNNSGQVRVYRLNVRSNSYSKIGIDIDGAAAERSILVRR